MRGAFMHWCVNTHQAKFKGTTPSMISFPGLSPQPEFLQWRNQRDWRQTPRWIDYGRTGVIDMGCHCRHHASRLLYQCFSKFCWCCCRDALRKSDKYADLPEWYIIQPIALETLGPINFSAMDFFTDRKIGVSSGDEREGRFLFSADVHIALQRYNAILLHESWSRRSGPLAFFSRFFVSNVFSF